jgi:Metallo-peptidase family M12
MQEVDGSTVNVGGTQISLSESLLTPVDIFAQGAQVFVDGIEIALQPSVWKSTSDSSVTIVKGANGKLLSASKRGPGYGRGNKLDVLPVDGNFFMTVDEDDLSEEALGHFTSVEALVEDVRSRSLRLESEPMKQLSPTFQAHPHGRSLTLFDIVELDLVIDSSFCTANGGSTDAQAKATSIVVEASTVHYEPFGVKLKIKKMVVHCNDATDPIKSLIASSTTCVELLAKFRTHVASASSSFAGDLVHLFHGFDYPDSIIGCAYINALCWKSGYKTGVNQMTWSGTLASQGRLLAHEIGHNLNAGHVTDASLMKASICSSCTFSSASKTTIMGAIDAASTLCIHQERK